MPDLKPCPFCGGRAEIIDDNSILFRYRVQCYDCGCTPGKFISEDMAIKYWNKRVRIKKWGNDIS